MIRKFRQTIEEICNWFFTELRTKIVIGLLYSNFIIILNAKGRERKTQQPIMLLESIDGDILASNYNRNLNNQLFSENIIEEDDVNNGNNQEDTTSLISSEMEYDPDSVSSDNDD